jgi:hypothetical protein
VSAELMPELVNAREDGPGEPSHDGTLTASPEAIN